ncbi:MAG TPA: PilZ domain-containing protein [Gammaproteobacteria bacterium]|nr:PilZ domain-containing protein [Gammaproteobacteria bacterium]
MEKRWNERKHIQINAMINSTETLISGKTDNIGMGGMYLKIAPGINIRSQYTISVSLSDGDDTVTFKSRIIRIDKDGLALKFSDYSPEMLSMLRKLLLDETDTHTRLH